MMEFMENLYGYEYWWIEPIGGMIILGLWIFTYFRCKRKKNENAIVQK